MGNNALKILKTYIFVQFPRLPDGQETNKRGYISSNTTACDAEMRQIGKSYELLIFLQPYFNRNIILIAQFHSFSIITVSRSCRFNIY